jgi:hypothetical protein
VKIMRTLIAAALAATCLAGGALRAEPVEEKNVVSGKTKLDPAKGYILVSGPTRQFGMFLRVPDDSTFATWEKDRQKALDKALRAYKTEHANWQVLANNAKADHSKPPAEPVEPTLQTVQVDPPELRDVAAFGPQFVYAKGETVTYLQAVKPGTYRWYGNVIGGAGLPAGGTCMCMGTVQFEVKAGVVTDTGNWLLSAPHGDEDMDVARLALKEANDKRVAAGKEPRLPLPPSEPRFGVPASLKDWPAVQAEFHASGKLNNYYGIFISRLSPVPGVLGYRRDTPVDLRTGQEIESPTLVSRARIKK